MADVLAVYSQPPILQWTLLVMDLDKEAFEPVLTNLLYQRAYYEEHGLPGIRDIGKAPFYAAMKGAGDRAAAEEANQAGMSLDEFRSLPSRERDRVMRTNIEQRMARASAVEELGERWRTLWDESAHDYFDPSNARWLPIREAIVSQVSQLDLGSGDLIERALEGEPEMTEQEALNGQLLVHLGIAGYLWRHAERETDANELGACRGAYEFMRDQGRLDDRPRKDILKEFALWAFESYLPIGLNGDEELEPARDVALHTILESTSLENEPLGIPAESADSAFRFGTLMREARDWIPEA